MKPIPEFEGIYSVSEEGKIWAHPRKGKGGHTGIFLKTWLIGHGYEMVALYMAPNKSIKRLVHRLVAQAFLPNSESLPEVNHKNGNIRDNRPENLEWCTSKQNKTHAWKAGLYTHKGTNHYLAKLDAEKVKFIRESYTGEWGEVAEFARYLHVSDATVWDVIKSKTWKTSLDN